MLTTAANYADFTPFRGRSAYRQRAKSVPEEQRAAERAKPQSERPRKLPRLQLRRPTKPRRRLEKRGALSRPDSMPPRPPNGRRFSFDPQSGPEKEEEAQGTLEHPPPSRRIRKRRGSHHLPPPEGRPA